LGPFAGSVTATGAVLWARTLKPGKALEVAFAYGVSWRDVMLTCRCGPLLAGRMRFEYSDDPDFSVPEVFMCEAGPDTDYTARVQIEPLDSGRVYFFRSVSRR
jgi:phosphodiesterase/alkaline phosphatase D-like protein